MSRALAPMVKVPDPVAMVTPLNLAAVKVPQRETSGDRERGGAVAVPETLIWLAVPVTLVIKAVEVKALLPKVPPVPMSRVLAPRIRVPEPVARVRPLKV